MKKVTWTIKTTSGRKLGVIKAKADSDTIEESCVRMFGPNIFLTKDGPAPEKDANGNWQYYCQHKDDGSVVYLPFINRPFPEEDEENGGTIVYDF